MLDMAIITYILATPYAVNGNKSHDISNLFICACVPYIERFAQFF